MDTKESWKRVMYWRRSTGAAGDVVGGLVVVDKDEKIIQKRICSKALNYSLCQPLEWQFL
jgi:hypothetical protein